MSHVENQGQYESHPSEVGYPFEMNCSNEDVRKWAVPFMQNARFDILNLSFQFQGGVWSLDVALCDGLMTMDVMLCTASIFNLCAISVDRFEFPILLTLMYCFSRGKKSCFGSPEAFSQERMRTA